MQQVQQREIPERMSWARAMIFGVGFFFLAAILIGQLPSYIFNLMTSDMVGLEQAFQQDFVNAAVKAHLAVHAHHRHLVAKTGPEIGV